MSGLPARPAKQPNGNPGVPASAPRRAVVKKKTDPFGWRKSQAKKPGINSLSKRPSPTANGSAHREPLEGPGSLSSVKQLRELEERRRQNGGWGDQPPPDNKGVAEFKLVTTKRELLEGIRHHIMRFNRPQDDPVDPTNQDQFPRPVSLHRRNAQQNPGARAAQKEELAPLNPADEAEAERLRQQKADRDAQRAMEQAQIATVLKNNEPKPRQNKRPKLTTYYKKDSDEHKKQAQLHYEETMPWHLEDVESKNVWVGSYIAALSDVNCAFVIDGQQFRMIPLQRYYKFDEKPHFHTLTLDEAEKAMKEDTKMTRWMIAEKAKSEAMQMQEETRAFLGGRPRVKTESSTSRAVPKSERADDYDIDMEGDEFQDDDEAPGFDADDEDARETKDRVRRDQLGANMFGEGDEDEVDKQREEEEKEKQRRRELGKDVRKGLTKHEHALDYADEDSDDEEKENNPFTDPSEDEDEEEEAEKTEENAKKPDGKEQLASGATTKGSNTPSGTKKILDAAKKGKSLKRPGSPNLSESSGNESSRKKKVKTNTKRPSSLVPSRSTTPMPNKVRGAGATSDGEATAGEGSDAGLKLKVKKIKINRSATGTPAGSRAGSPVPTGDKSASPTKADPPADRIQPSEIRAAINAHPEGIKVADLMKKFDGRINKPGHMTRNEWIQLVRQNGNWGPDKLLRPKVPKSS